MGLVTFHAGLKAQLLADTGLSAWAATHFKKAFSTINGNREIDTLETHEVPAFIFELDDGDTGPEVSNYSQHVTTALQVAVAWFEADPVRAFVQRLALPDIMIHAVGAEPTLGNNIDGAWVERFQPVRGGRPFVHVLRFSVAGEYNVVF